MHQVKIIEASKLPPYDLGFGHPFAAHRQLPLFDLLHNLSLIKPEEILESELAKKEELELAHAPEYIEMIEAISEENPAQESLMRAFQFGMGSGDCPIAPGLHDSARAIAGGTLQSARAVARGEAIHAYNPGGGLHHAMHRMASGFCIYNDIVIGIREARKLGVDRVLYVDFDVHHGDGVERAFYDDPSVLTLSFHESPDYLFPGTGRVNETGEGKGKGFAVNVPLAPFTADESWLEMINAVLIPIAKRFKPNLILSQHGCDTHFDDPLANLCITTNAMQEAAKITHKLAHEVCDGKWVAVGGGGYQPYHCIPRVWTMVWAVMTGRELPEKIPEAWIKKWQGDAGRPLPEKFLDDPHPDPRSQQVVEINKETLEKLKRELNF
ncbi:acetoin utilization protein AcuC [Bdellovibrionota bacterium]